MTQSRWIEGGGEPALPTPEPRRRRIWPLFLLALALVVLAVARRHRQTGTAPDVLRVGSQRGGTKAMMLASGVLQGAPYHVEWAEFPAAQNLLEAAGAGAIDLGIAGDAPFQFAYQAGQPIVAVGAMAARARPAGSLAILVPGGSPLRSIADLRGKKIATTRGSIGHYLIVRALSARGLTPRDVNVTFLTPGDSKAAFDAHAIDAWATWSPYTGTALQAGARILGDGRDYLSGYSFDVANTNAAHDKSALLRDFLDREAKAMLWAKAHPQAYARVLARETGLPPAIALFHVTHLPIVRVPIDQELKAEERKVIAVFRSAGALSGDRPPDLAYQPLAPEPPPAD